MKLVNRVRVILELDEANGRKPLTQAQIAEKVGPSRQAINDAKKAYFAADNVTEFLKRKNRETPPVAPKITGDVEAH